MKPSTTSEQSPPSSMVVALWPGSNFGRNPFVELYSESLRRYGIRVIDVQSPGDFEASPDLSVFHIHWPEQVFWAGGSHAAQAVRIIHVLRQLSRMRSSRTKIVWMVHNIRPHDMSVAQRAMWAVYSRLLARLTDAVMTVSPTTMTAVTREIPALRNKPAGYVPHPAYSIAPSPATRAQFRASLEIPSEAKVFCFFGNLRAYKGIETLTLAFARLEQQNYRLIIVGEPNGLSSCVDALKAFAEADERVIVKAERLSEEDLAAMMEASDIIVLPFTRYLHSGSLMYSLCASKPTLTPHTIYASDLMKSVGGDWIQMYEGPLLPEHLEKAFVPSGRPDLSFATMDKVGGKAAAFYRTICADR